MSFPRMSKPPSRSRFGWHPYAPSLADIAERNKKAAIQQRNSSKVKQHHHQTRNGYNHIRICVQIKTDIHIHQHAIQIIPLYCM